MKTDREMNVDTKISNVADLIPEQLGDSGVLKQITLADPWIVSLPTPTRTFF
jgi:hypothetical protein